MDKEEILNCYKHAISLYPNHVNDLIKTLNKVSDDDFLEAFRNLYDLRKEINFYEMVLDQSEHISFMENHQDAF